MRCYVHGSRSLEKVAYFLQRRGKPGAYRLSDLPAPALLDPHVDLAEVLRIARARLPISCLVTRLAPAIHASYSKHAAGSKQPDPPCYVAERAALPIQALDRHGDRRDERVHAHQDRVLGWRQLS